MAEWFNGRFRVGVVARGGQGRKWALAIAIVGLVVVGSLLALGLGERFGSRLNFRQRPHAGGDRGAAA